MIDEYPEYKQARWNAPVGDITGEGISPFSPDERHRARLWAVYQVPLRLGTASVSALEAFDSGTGYEAVGSIDPRPYVTNPGYANPLGNAAGQVQSIEADADIVHVMCSDRAKNLHHSNGGARTVAGWATEGRGDATRPWGSTAGLLP